jgi:hypothetical protein
MSSPRSIWNVTTAMAIASRLSIAASPTPASAGCPYFFKGPTSAPGETTCLRANHLLQRRGEHASPSCRTDPPRGRGRTRKAAAALLAANEVVAQAPPATNETSDHLSKLAVGAVSVRAANSPATV